MQTGQVHGMITFESAINELVRKGTVSEKTDIAFSPGVALEIIKQFNKRA